MDLPQELFPEMMQSLSKATGIIADEMAKMFQQERKSLSEEQWTEYGDNLEFLHGRLVQLNTVLHFEYLFEEGFPMDIINYTKLLEEHRTNCEELVGYLLTKSELR